MLPCTKLVKNAPKRPDIRFVIIGFFLTKLWRQVIRGPYNRVGKILSLHRLSDSQVAYFDLLSFGQKEVHGLDVSMQDLPCVQVLDAETGLDEQSPNFVLL